MMVFFFGFLPLELRAATSDTLFTGDQQNTVLTEELHDTVIDQARESKARIKNAEKTSDKEAWSLKQGGWLSSTYRYYKNIDNQTSLEDFLKWSWTQEAYLWLYLDYKATANAYIQVGDSYVDRGVGPTYTGIGADHEGPVISMAYSKINLQPEYNIPLAVTLGRQYLFLGRGLAYEAIDDGLLIEYTQSPFYLKQFITKTKPRDDNIDYSVPGFDKEGDRAFAGAEISYLGLNKTSLYAFGLLQKDRSSPEPDTSTQNFHYNSYYLGGGISSKFAEPLELWSEFVSEEGGSYTDASRTRPQKTKIDAWAYVAGGKYRFDLPSHPILETEYAYGSGDEDRTNVTNTLGGDLDGNDKNFLYFGYYQAGYALRPRLSNINIWSLNASCQPLERYSLFKKTAIGTKYYLYWKDKDQGGTSDIESTKSDNNIGQEVDFYLHSKITDHWTLNARYGIFFPGEAFPEDKRNATQYFYTQLTLNF